MDSQTHLDALAAEGTRLLDVAATDPGAAVAACPGWTVIDLARHVGQVYSFVDNLVTAGGTDRPSVAPDPAPEDDEAVIDWARGRHQSLLATLRSTDPTMPLWNWAGTGSAAFYHRRMAHESLIHRWDAETAVGSQTPIDGDLGGDCVDEVLHVGMQHSTNPAKEFAYPNGSLHLHRTDGEGEWLVRLEDGRPVVTREHAKGDVAVRGSGGDLALYIWGRGGSDLEVFGDQALADAWAQVAP